MKLITCLIRMVSHQRVFSMCTKTFKSCKINGIEYIEYIQKTTDSFRLLPCLYGLCLG